MPGNDGSGLMVVELGRDHNATSGNARSRSERYHLHPRGAYGETGFRVAVEGVTKAAYGEGTWLGTVCSRLFTWKPQRRNSASCRHKPGNVIHIETQ